MQWNVYRTVSRMVAGLLLSWIGVGLMAQDAAPEKSAASQTNDIPKSYELLWDDWKNLEQQLTAKQGEFEKAEEGVQRDNLRREFEDLLRKSYDLLNQLREAALVKLETESMDPAVVKTLMGILVNDARNGRDDVVLAAADRMIAKQVDVRNWQAAAKLEKLSLSGREIFEEILIRQQERQKDDLPRVKILTNRGDLVVELYENEAPNTVANFISLAKSGFYKDLKFHRVIDGFMAQTGSPKGDGTDGPGYTIEDECRLPEYRRHFSHVLSMAKTSAPDSGGSQFFITFNRGINVQGLDGKHTAFGRVISGADVLGKLTRTHQVLGRSEQPIPNAEPDKILGMEVIRDRGHAYEPKKLADKKTANDEAPAPPADSKSDSGTDPPLTDDKKDGEKQGG